MNRFCGATLLDAVKRPLKYVHTHIQACVTLSRNVLPNRDNTALFQLALRSPFTAVPVPDSHLPPALCNGLTNEKLIGNQQLLTLRHWFDRNYDTTKTFICQEQPTYFHIIYKSFRY